MSLRLSSAVAALCLAAISSGSAHAQAPANPQTVTIATAVEVPALKQAKEGVIQALADRGYVDGRTISLRFENAGGDGQRIQDIAKALAAQPPAVIVTLTTPMAQAVHRAQARSPIVFAAVTDPVKAGIVAGFGRPVANITGASDLAPLAEQMKLFREIVPGLKRLGFIFDARLVSPVATLAALRSIATPMDVSIVEVPVQSGSDASEAAKGLIGRVDALYLPNDTTVNPALGSIVTLSHGAGVPVFTAEANGVERDGALASVGLDYLDVGRLAGQMAAEILGGRAVGDIETVLASQKVSRFRTVVNRQSARQLGLALPPALVARATSIVD